MRFEFTDNIREAADGVGDSVSAFLQEVDDPVSEVDVADLEQAHLVLTEPEASHQEQRCTVALMVLGANDRVDRSRLVRLPSPVGLAPTWTLDREHGIA